jgi:hypothetical protein
LPSSLGHFPAAATDLEQARAAGDVRGQKLDRLARRHVDRPPARQTSGPLACEATHSGPRRTRYLLRDAMDVAAAEQDLASRHTDDLARREQRLQLAQRGGSRLGSSSGTTTWRFAM